MAAVSTTITLTAADVSALRAALRARVATLESWLDSPVDNEDSIAARAMGTAELDRMLAVQKKVRDAAVRVEAKYTALIKGEK